MLPNFGYHFMSLVVLTEWVCTFLVLCLMCLLWQIVLAMKKQEDLLRVHVPYYRLSVSGSIGESYAWLSYTPLHSLSLPTVAG